MQLLKMPKTIQLSMQTVLWQGWKVKLMTFQFVWEAEACFWGKGCSLSYCSAPITTCGSLLDTFECLEPYYKAFDLT